MVKNGRAVIMEHVPVAQWRQFAGRGQVASVLFTIRTLIMISDYDYSIFYLIIIMTTARMD